MASAKQQEHMLLTEHFSWPPISLIDDIINVVNEVLYRCTDSFETGLLTADPTLLGFAERYAAEGRLAQQDDQGHDMYPDARLEIEEGVVKLETLMENAVDRNFDRLEIWTLRNVLCLPKEGDLGAWVRLGSYENLQAPPKDASLTPEVLFALRRKVAETQKLHAALVAEKTRNAMQIARLRALLSPAATPKREPRHSTSPAKADARDEAAPFAFLTHTPAAQALGIQPLPAPASTTSGATSTSHTSLLNTHTAFTTSHLPHLRNLLASLKPHLPSTALPSTQPSNNDDAVRERKMYLESQSKRILERRGVDTKDGVEGVWNGPRVAASEVGALENVVRGLHRGQREGDDEGKGMDLS